MNVRIEARVKMVDLLSLDSFAVCEHKRRRRCRQPLIYVEAFFTQPFETNFLSTPRSLVRFAVCVVCMFSVPSRCYSIAIIREKYIFNRASSAHGMENERKKTKI